MFPWTFGEKVLEYKRTCLDEDDARNIVSVINDTGLMARWKRDFTVMHDNDANNPYE